MYLRRRLLLVVLLATSLASQALASSELTFELPDNAVQCFYEEIGKGTRCTLEFQVVTGGNYDVDLKVIGPGSRVLYSISRKQFDSVDFDAYETGEYEFCFSNEFSSFTHKIVYFDFIVGDEAPLTDQIGAHHTALTLLESSTVRIHEALRLVEDYQTHHRIREATGRSTAEFLAERVQYWSLGESILFVLIGLLQVFVLRRFFTDKRSKI